MRFEVQGGRANRQRALVGCVVIILAALACYLPALRAGFIWDDDSMLTANPLVQSPAGLFSIWFSTTPTDYWPLTYSTLWLEWRLWGMNAAGYHATNVILHTLSALVLWRVLKQLKISGAWLAALIFVVHPVNVESVAWITERKNTLCMLFFLLAASFYFRSNSEFRAAAPARNRTWYWLALFAFVLALLSKTSVVMLPFILLLVAWWQKGSINRRDVLRTAPFFVVSLAFGLITIWFQTHRAIGGDIVRTDAFPARLAGAGWAVWLYLYKALIPLNLAFVYPQWKINPQSMLAYLPLAALLAGIALCWKFRARWGRNWLFAIGYFVLMLLPVLGFFKVYFQRYSLVADHWQYFALIGVIAFVVGGMSSQLRSLSARAKPTEKNEWIWRGRFVAAAIVVALTALSWRQTQLYADNETLWHDTLRKNPDSWLALNNLGLVLIAKGDFAGAKALHLRSLEIKPDQIEAHNNLGEILLAEGKIVEAKAHYLRALELDQNFAMTHYNLGNVLDREGKTEEAMESYRKALGLVTHYPDAHNNLGCLLVGQEKLDEAIAHFQQALSDRPDYPDALNNLGSTLTERGRAAEALPLLGKAIQLKPAYVDAHHNLGNAWAALHNSREALAEYQTALSLNPGHWPAHYKLGNLLFSQGNSELAAEHYRAALAGNSRLAEAHYQLSTILMARKEVEQGLVHYREAVRLKPDWLEALNNLSWVLATQGDAQFRDGPRAVELAARTVELTHTNDAAALDTLAAAYAEAGRFSDAVVAARKGIDLARSSGTQRFADEMEGRLRLYENAQPFREPDK